MLDSFERSCEPCFGVSPCNLQSLCYSLFGAAWRSNGTHQTCNAWCELYSKLQHLEDAATVFTQNVHKLTGGDNGRPGILFWVVSRKGKDLTSDEMDMVSSLFQKLQTCGILTHGACCTERGENKVICTYKGASGALP
jgi:hypothetical protein